MINGLKLENTDFLVTIARKDEEIGKLRELFSEMTKKNKMRQSNQKEVLKSKKHLRDKEQEITRLNETIRSLKLVIEEQRASLANQSVTRPRPNTAGNMSASSIQHSFQQQQSSFNVAGAQQLRQDL